MLSLYTDLLVIEKSNIGFQSLAKYIMSMPYQCVTMGLSRILVIYVKKNKSLGSDKKGASILRILHGVEETLRPRRYL